MDSMVLFIVVSIVTILLSMTLHEAMHAFASYWLGDDTAKMQGRLTLNPLAHIDPVGTLLIPGVLIFFIIISGVALPIFGAAKPVPFNPLRVRYGDYGAAIVALAGPLTNLLLAFVAGLSLRVLLANSSDVGIFADVLTTFIFVNLGFFAFNILPVPPLDGSRVLYAIAPDALKEGLRSLERYGLMIIFAMVFLFQGTLTTVIGGIINFFFSIFVGGTPFQL